MNMKWIVNFTMIIVFFGIIFGLVLGGLNPWKSPAEADQIYMETAHQQAVYQLEERLMQAKTDSEIQAIQREQELLNAQHEHDMQVLAQDIENRQTAFRTWMTILILVGGAFAITIFIGTVLWIGSKAIVNVRSVPSYQAPTQTFIPPIEKRIRTWPERKPYEPLETPQHRYERRLAERQQEITAQKEINELIARMNIVRNPAQMSKEEYNNRPLAGD